MCATSLCVCEREPSPKSHCDLGGVGTPKSCMLGGGGGLVYMRVKLPLQVQPQVSPVTKQAHDAQAAAEYRCKYCV
jgi:hypothetical protein